MAFPETILRISFQQASLSKIIYYIKRILIIPDSSIILQRVRRKVSLYKSRGITTKAQINAIQTSIHSIQAYLPSYNHNYVFMQKG
jgi:hypothetical protein